MLWKEESLKRYSQSILTLADNYIEAEGKCIETNIKCVDCPFSSVNNAVTEWGCWAVGYSDIFSAQEQRADEILVRNCKKFINEFFGEVI
ncbi:hypothetical protein [Fusobacterium ulcerans]|uniref:hypothetical protein n=1 Tax=Fusobacterium ulcerans TaxID=861 RepID=UPI0026F0076E|nr:hypothetical protein [Fusobacterium ulcerans]